MTETAQLRALLICPDDELRRELATVMEQQGHLQVAEDFSHYPNGAELSRALRGHSPECVVLSFEQPEVAVAVMRFLDSEADGLPVVATHPLRNSAANMDIMRRSARAGAREFLMPPVTASDFDRVIGVVQHALKRVPVSYAATDHIYSFLPARAGVGTTSVAMNAAAAFAQLPGMRVLLTDLDLCCGMIRFLWKLPHDLSIVDALHRADDMDSGMWPQLVSQRNGVDILHSGSINPQANLEPSQIQSLIDFARTSYNALFFDLSGNMERHSLLVMQESKQVFLVCNPEPGSLYQAHQKLTFLHEMGLDGRVSAVVNRFDQDWAMPMEQVESFLQIPIAAQFSDVRAEISRAEASGQPVVHGANGSVLARQFFAFAKTLRERGRLSIAA